MGCIDVDRAKYRWHHLHNPYAYRDENLKRLGYVSYRHYLCSGLWRAIRERVLARDRWMCGCCGREANSVHHRAYDPKTLSGECLHALSAVCRRCHQQIEQPNNRGRSRWDRLQESSETVFKKQRKRKHRVVYDPPVWAQNHPPRLVKKEEEGSEVTWKMNEPSRCPWCGSLRWIYKGDRQWCADCGR